MLPGEIIPLKGEIIINQDRPAAEVKVLNLGDRPIQVGSHYHFYEVNSSLDFDRSLAYGRRLDILAGTSVRFEPGQERTVRLLDYGGNRRVFGFQGQVMGQLEDTDV
jgi:urease subunit beta